MKRIPVTRLAPAALAGASLDTVVVMDIFRATTTATVLLGRVDELAVVATPADLGRLPAATRHLLFSELELPDLHPAVDNSPSLARDVPLDGRVPALVTTNGTRALCAAAAAGRRVLIASFLDAEAVARHLVDRAPREVTLVPAGQVATGERHVEDEACADALEALLAGRAPDWRGLEQRCRADERLSRRIAEIAADAEVAFAFNTIPAVGEFSYQDGLGRIVRLA